MIGMPQFSATPHGAVNDAGVLQTLTVPHPRSWVSHRLCVIPQLGSFPAPTHTRKPSSLSWNELPEPPQSALNGAGSSEHEVRNRRP